MRAAVVIVENGRVALIERVRDGRTYFVFPGGRVETGESPQQAAVREAHEELGVSVDLGDLIFVAHRDGRERRYYFARIAGGTVGTGRGTEMMTSGTTAKGTYRPVWVDPSILTELDVRPRALSEALASWTGDKVIRWIGEYE
jgi:8-oxo-dGTP pyrophosphatase MutT (NUDIX family)